MKMMRMRVYIENNGFRKKNLRYAINRPQRHLL